MNCVENWHALAIAILYKSLIPPEYCFALWEHGKLRKTGSRQGDDYSSRLIKSLRKYGMSWAEIVDVTGYKYPASMVLHWEKRYGVIKV